MKSRLIYGCSLGVLMISVLFYGCIIASAENTSNINIVMTIDNPVMQVNNENVNIDENGTSPVIVDGRTLVPIRAVAEALGGSIEWNDTEKELTIIKENTSIELVIGKLNAEVNGSNVALDTAPKIINGRTMLPLRFVAENLGADVNWNSEKREITISSRFDNAVVETTTEAYNSVEETTVVSEVTSDSKNLIVYFTLPETDGVDTVAGASRVVVDGELYGSMEFMADTVEKTVGGDKFEIKTVQEYPTIHKPLVDFADEELENDARPELATYIENFENYDTIYIGYPIWWSDMPMPLYSFFDEYDFKGKTIIPFSSHGGSGLSGSVRTIKELEPDALVKDGYTVSRDDIADNAKAVSEDFAAWLKSNI